MITNIKERPVTTRTNTNHELSSFMVLLKTLLWYKKEIFRVYNFETLQCTKSENTLVRFL